MISSSYQQEIVIKFLNYFMIILSVFASIAIFTSCGIGVKLALVFILLAYLCFFLKHNIIDYFLNFSRKSKNYDEIHRLNVPSELNAHKINNNQMILGNSMLRSFNKVNNSITPARNDDNTIEKINQNYSKFNESFDIKDLSVQVLRSLSRSKIEQNLSNSFHRSRSRRGPQSLQHIEDSTGKSFNELFKKSNNTSSRSSIRSSRLDIDDDFITIRPRKYIINESYQILREKLQERYLQTLSSNNLVKSEVTDSYSRINAYLWKILKRIHYENIRIQSNLRELVQNHFSIKIVNNANLLKKFDSSMLEGSKTSMSMKQLNLRLSLFYFQRNTLKELNLQLKYQINLSLFEKRFQQIFKQRLSFDASIGCQTLTQSSNPESIFNYLNQKQQKLSIISQFLNKNEEIVTEFKKKYEGEHTQKYYKERVYILYLFTQHMNRLLVTNQGRILLNDGIYLNKVKRDKKYEYEIYLQVGYDFMIPHYNLNKKGAEISCQPGDMNYASIIYLYLHCLSSEERLLRSNSELYGLIQSVV